jgi:YVTN family beta-propeller protein
MKSKSVLLVLAMLLSQGLQAQQVRIVQTNSRDDVVHLLDPSTHSIVGEIRGIPVNHGAAASPDGRYLYFSSEAKVTLDVVDTSNFSIIKEIPLTARPNNISIGKDGRFVYVGIMAQPGGIDIIDTQSMEKVHHIETGSLVHNTYVTPDGKHLVAGTFGGRGNLDVYSTETREREFFYYAPRNSHNPLEGVRPIAFDTNPDGSTRNMYVQISRLHGFTVVNFADRREVSRFLLPSVAPEEQDKPPFNDAPAHGIGVSPDQKTLWVCSRLNGRVYGYRLEDMSLIADIKVGSHPDWLTFTPDSRFVYVANGHSNDVSVIDTQELREVARIPVGNAPKRNITFALPQ